MLTGPNSRGGPVPVTVKLSKKFYDRFGHDVVAELVEWFNTVDLTYRTDLRELNELNFARFDAKVEQRFAEAEARLERRFNEFEVKWVGRIGELEAKVEARFAVLESKWETRFAELEATVERRFAEQDSKWEKRLAELETRLSNRMFRFWIAQAATTAALVFGVVRILQR